MPKKIILILIAAVLLIGLIIGGYLGWEKWKEFKVNKSLDKAGDAAEKLIEDATKGVLPSIGVNLLENKPDVNPADKANPFKDIKTNPFAQ